MWRTCVTILLVGMAAKAEVIDSATARTPAPRDTRRAESIGVIHPRVKLSVFEQTCDMAGLSDAQHQRAAQGWTTYETRFASIEASLADRESQLRIECLNADDRQQLSDEERDQMYAGLVQQWKRSFDDAEAAFAALLDEVSAIIDDTQRSGWNRAVYWLNRRTRLDPLHRPNGLFYLGEGCDLLLLVDAATKKGGELEWRFTDGAVDAPADALAEARRALDACCERYEQAMNAALLASDAKFLEERLKVGVALMRDRNEQARSAWLNATRIAERRSKLNHKCADEVALICTNLGLRDQTLRWRERSLRGMYPAIARDETPDRMFEWIEKSVSEVGIVQRAASVYAQYRRDRLALWEECARVLATMRESHDPAQPPVRSGAGGTSLEGLLHHHSNDLLNRRKSLANETRCKFATVVPTSLAERFDRACSEFSEAPASDGFPFSF